PHPLRLRLPEIRSCTSPSTDDQKSIVSWEPATFNLDASTNEIQCPFGHAAMQNATCVSAPRQHDLDTDDPFDGSCGLVWSELNRGAYPDRRNRCFSDD